MPTGQSLAHSAGNDQRLPPLHVPYGEPKPKRTGLDWSAMRGEEPAPAPPKRTRRCKDCGDPIDHHEAHRQCDRCRARALAVDPHRQDELVRLPEEQPMPEITTPYTGGQPLAVTEYVRDAAEVLSRTEGHPDQMVRDLRKLAVQAIRALHTAAAPKVAPEPKPVAPGGPPTLSEIRAWARANGHQVSDKGALSRVVHEAYAKAHP